MVRLADDQYYKDRPVAHTAQGDLYLGVPCTYAGAIDSTPPQGARKRPGVETLAEEAGWAEITWPSDNLVIVCSYTCGFVAQPRGQQGYSHEYRLVAPILPLSQLVRKAGLSANEARRLVSSGSTNGLLYLPPPPGHAVPTEEGEFSGQLVALLYRPSLVTQGILDARKRIARLSVEAQRSLCTSLAHTVTPWLFDPEDDITLKDPDMSDSWVALESEE